METQDLIGAYSTYTDATELAATTHLDMQSPVEPDQVTTTVLTTSIYCR